MLFCLKNSTLSLKKINKLSQYLGLFNNINFFFNASRFFCLDSSNKTKQCLGIIQSKKSKFYNCRCRHQVKEGNFCGRHKNTINFFGVCLNKAKELDQYYTKPFVVDLCIKYYLSVIQINNIFDLIIEPSAGSGAFIHSLSSLCNNTIFIDVDPKTKLIVRKNFLEFNNELSIFRKVHIIGNPPFKLIGEFIKKASYIAHVIGFILPLSFRKESMKNRFPLNFHCVLEQVLPKKNFIFNNKLVTVPVVFQV